MENIATLDKLATFDFVVDKAIDVVYVGIIAARRFIIKRYDVLAKAFDNDASVHTRDGYKIDTLNKILAAMKAEPIEVPSDKEGYFAWLKNPQK